LGLIEEILASASPAKVSEGSRKTSFYAILGLRDVTFPEREMTSLEVKVISLEGEMKSLERDGGFIEVKGASLEPKMISLSREGGLIEREMKKLSTNMTSLSREMKSLDRDATSLKPKMLNNSTLLTNTFILI